MIDWVTPSHDLLNTPPLVADSISLYAPFTCQCRWLLFGWLITGIVLSFLSVSTCNFLDYGEIAHEGDDESVDSVSLSAGLYMYPNATSRQCDFYPEDRIFDNQESYARLAAAVAPAAATSSLLLLTLECMCCCFHSRVCPFLGCVTHPLIALGLIIAQVCQGLTFLFFGSEELCGGNLIKEIMRREPCSFGTGSAYSAIALCLYFLSGILCLCAPRPDPCTCDNKRHPDDSGRGADIEMKRTASSSTVGVEVDDSIGRRELPRRIPSMYEYDDRYGAPMRGHPPPLQPHPPQPSAPTQPHINFISLPQTQATPMVMPPQNGGGWFNRGPSWPWSSYGRNDDAQQRRQYPRITRRGAVDDDADEDQSMLSSLSERQKNRLLMSLIASSSSMKKFASSSSRRNRDAVPAEEIDSLLSAMEDGMSDEENDGGDDLD